MVKKLAGTFSRIGKCRILVIGDLMLDTYTIGKARRISPEAPVAVVQVHQEESRPGGSGNVVLNLISLGSEVICIGRIGNDSAGQILLEALKAENVDVRGIAIENGYQTPVKNRIIAEGQQIVRIDHEKNTPVTEQVEQSIIDQLPLLLKDVQVLAISDYGKGLLSKTLLAEVIEQAKALNIPIIADPKGIDFAKYAGVSIIKPNLGEAYAASNLPLEASLDKVAEKVLQISNAEYLMITRSESGISTFHRAGVRQDFPVRVREVKDVTGAGDTVLAMLSVALANELPLEDAVHLCNIAAGIAIERFGCARITLPELAQRLLEYDVVNKVFDEHHIFALQQALKGKKFNLLGLKNTSHLNAILFKAIKQLGQVDECGLLVYVADPNPDFEFIDMLASLHAIQFIVVNGESLRGLCRLIEPQEVYMFDDNQLQRLTNSSFLIST